MTPDPRHPNRPRRRRAVAPAVALAVLAVGFAGGCQKETPMSPSEPTDAAASCRQQPGDVSVLRGGTFPLDPSATLRAGLQYEVKQEPRTWKVMFMGSGVSESHDLAAGDTVTVGGHTVTVRDACADKIVLTLATAGSTTAG